MQSASGAPMMEKKQREMNAMRRTDREQGTEFIRRVIDSCGYLVLSMTGADGLPYCVPVTPVRSGEDIYFHCAPEGAKVDALRANPRVAMAFVGEAETVPRKFTARYSSVLARGTASQVTEEGEQVEALRLLCLRHCPEDMDRFDEVVRAWLPRTAVWKIHIDAAVGKANPGD